MRTHGVLFISPCPEDAARLSVMLRSLLDVTHVLNIEQARTILQNQKFEVILTEADLGRGDWQDVLAIARQFSPESKVIVTNPQADGRFWSKALNLGAYDVVAQPFQEPEVRRILNNACTRYPAAAVASMSAN